MINYEGDMRQETNIERYLCNTMRYEEYRKECRFRNRFREPEVVVKGSISKEKILGFVTNLSEARRLAIIVIEAKNNIAKEHASDLLETSIDNMIEELNTIIRQPPVSYVTAAKIDKDALLRSLLEDAELTVQTYSRK